MKQLGAIISQLSRLRLDKIGSLFEGKSFYIVKTCISPGLLLHYRYTLRDISRGPFLQESDYYKPLLSVFLFQIQCLVLGHHAFFAPIPIPAEYNSYVSYLSATDRWNNFVTVGSKIDSIKIMLDYSVAGQFLEDMIPSFTIKSNEFADSGDDGYPIRHPDFSATNIFVDDDCNIPCIYHWLKFPYSVQMAELPLPRGWLGPFTYRRF